MAAHELTERLSRNWTHPFQRTCRKEACLYAATFHDSSLDAQGAAVVPYPVRIEVAPRLVRPGYHPHNAGTEVLFTATGVDLAQLSAMLKVVLQLHGCSFDEAGTWFMTSWQHLMEILCVSDPSGLFLQWG